MSVFQTTGTAAQKALIDEAVAACQFDFTRIVPGLQKATGKSQVGVSFAPMSGGVGGWASSDGSIQINSSMSKADQQGVFLMEAAHEIDFFLLTDSQRKAITAAFHGGSSDRHSWFEPSSYFDRVGEAWTTAFTRALSPFQVDANNYTHPSTPAVESAVRTVLDGFPPVPPVPPTPPVPATHPALDVVYSGTVGGRAVALKGTLAPPAGGGESHPVLTGPLTGSIPHGGLFGGPHQLSLTGTATPVVGQFGREALPAGYLVRNPDWQRADALGIDWRKCLARVLVAVASGKSWVEAVAGCLGSAA